MKASVLAFMHLTKTGWTTIMCMIHKNVGRGRIWHSGTYVPEAERKSIEELYRTRPNLFSCVAGHMG